MSYFLGALSAIVTLNDSDYQKKLSNVENSSVSSFKKIADAAESYLTTTSLVNFATSSTKAFYQQEAAIEAVRASLRNLGEETEYNTRKMSEFASEMQKLTIYGDEVTLAAMSQGLRLGIKPEEIEHVTKAAMGLAAKIGTDLPTAMMLLSRASKGQTQMLTRYGIVLDQTKSKEEQYQEILKISTDSFSLAEDAAKTAAGSMTQLSNAWGDTKEIFGEQLQKSIQSSVGFLTELLSAFNSSDEATKKLATSVVLLGGGFIVLNRVGGVALVKNLLHGTIALGHMAVKAMTSKAAMDATTASTVQFGATNTAVSTQVVTQQTAMQASMQATAAAAGVLNIALGATTVVLTGLYLAAQYADDKAKARVELAEKEYEETKALTEALREKQEQDQENLFRLEELSKYQHLLNSEQDEAKKIIKELSKDYSELGISIDEATGKINIHTDAWKELLKQQKEKEKQAAQKELDAATKKMLAAKQYAEKQLLSGVFGSWDEIGNTKRTWNDEAAKLSVAYVASDSFEQMLEQAQDLHNVLMATDDDEDATDAVGKYIEAIKECIKKEKGLAEVEKKSAKQKSEIERKTKQVNKALQDSVDSFRDKKWKIEFDDASAEKQLAMLKEKLNKFLEKNESVIGKDAKAFLIDVEEGRAENQEQVKIAEELLSIQKEIADAEKKIADNQKKSTDELKRQQDALKEREKTAEYNRLDTQKKLDAKRKEIADLLSSSGFDEKELTGKNINTLASEEIKVRSKILDLRKQEAELVAGLAEQEKKAAEERAKAEKKAEEERQRAEEARKQADDKIRQTIADESWNNQYSDANIEEKMKMVRDKMNSIAAKYSVDATQMLKFDTNAISGDKLADYQKIFELNRNLVVLEKQAAEEQERLAKEKAEKAKKEAEAARKKAEAEEKAAKKQSEAEAELLSESIKKVQEVQWQNLFRSSDFNNQIKMVNAKMQELAKPTGMTWESFLSKDVSSLQSKEEVELYRTLLDLSEQRKDIEEKIADAKAKQIEAQKKRAEEEKKERQRMRDFWAEEAEKERKREQERLDNINAEKLAYQEMISSQRQNLSEQKKQAAIDKLRGAGKYDEANKIVWAELQRAIKNYKSAKKEYIALREISETSGTMDFERMEKLRKFMEEKFSDAKRFNAMLENAPDADDPKNIKNVVGSWSLAELSRMTSDSPEAQTARNTKETVQQVRKLNENLENNKISLFY